MNAIIEWINQRYVEITATGLTSYIVVRDIVKSIISRKVTDNFDGLKNVVQNSSKAQALRDKVVFEKVDALESQLLKERELSFAKDLQIQQLTELNVTALSVANVPLQAKENFSKSISSISNLSENTKKTLQQSIEVQKQALEQQAKDKQDAFERLKEI